MQVNLDERLEKGFTNTEVCGVNYKNIKLEEKTNYRIAWINRESPLNPLNMETLEEIDNVLGLEKKETTIIAGMNKAFSAGADIKNFLQMKESDAFQFAAGGHRIMNSISSYPFPVIAAIHGYALGGGFELAMACDIRICTPDAQLGLPEVTLGIVPGFGGTQRLKELIGEGNAFYLASTGMRITAERALQMGIVNEIADKVVERSEEIASRYAELPPVSLRLIKSLIRKIPDEGFQDEIDAFAEVFGTEDHETGIKAFLEKKKPQFKGR
ncbi:enoyl-CoA hydratase-related protein [Oxyplasma meridianum]|uniref:Enoyl-CoA hydratase-related protein n=1 Tax=Oxyplasma meridianum TaxID=3073602 RepID=A0AAX4NET9_9ARCH